MNAPTINKLLTALNECTEWGQVFILDALSNYSPRDAREAHSICERITPRLAHANAAVVLSAVKVSSTSVTVAGLPDYKDEKLSSVAYALKGIRQISDIDTD